MNNIIIYWGSNTPTVTYTKYDNRGVAVSNRQYTKVSLASICRLMRISDSKVHYKKATDQFFIIHY